MTFNVSLSNALTVPVSLTATTTNGTAAAPSDFAELVVVPIDFAPGQTSKTVSVTVVGDGDGAVELDEAFQVVLSGTLPSGSAFARSAATGTIINDDIVVVKPRAPHETGERSPPPKHTCPPSPTRLPPTAASPPREMTTLTTTPQRSVRRTHGGLRSSRMNRSVPIDGAGLGQAVEATGVYRQFASCSLFLRTCSGESR